MKILLAVLSLFLAGYAQCQVPYVSAATNNPFDQAILGRSGGSGGHNRWITNSSSGVSVAAGTNITAVTNSEVVTISVSNTNLPVVSAGTNTTVVTNGLNYTVSSSAPGQSISAGTNITAVTNGSVVTLSVSTNPVVIAGTNVTVQTNGLAYTVNATSSGSGTNANIGPGTVNYIPLWLPGGTNITNSIIIQESTNQIAYHSLPVANTYTNGFSNIWYEGWSSATTNYGIKMIENGRLFELKQFTNGDAGNNVFGGMRFNDAWLINGLGTTAVGGHNGDLLPLAANALVVGSSSLPVKSFTAGTAAIGFHAGTSATYPTIEAGYGWGFDNSGAYLFAQDNSTKEAQVTVLGNGAVLDMGLGGFAGGGTVGSPIAFITSIPGQPNQWAISTNNNSAARPVFSRIMGSVAAGGADRSGGDLFLAGGKSTGTGTNGSVGFQTAEAKTTSSSTNQPYTRMFVSAEPTVLTTNSATGICTITLPTSLTSFGCIVTASTHVDNGTDGTDVTEQVAVNAFNKSGTVTTHVTLPALSTTISTGSSGCTTVWTATVSSTTVTIKVNATTTGQLDTVSTCRWQLQLNSGSVSLVTPLQ